MKQRLFAISVTFVLCAGGLCLLLALIIPIFAVEGGLRRPRYFPSPGDYQVQWEAGDRRVAIRSADRLRLLATYVPVRTAEDPQRCLLLLHGVGSHGHQMPGMLTRFPRRGYSVLAPDSRAHGESEGLQVTYGRKEAQDLKLWVNWLEKQPGCQGGIYALGISMGAAVLLQALAEEPRIRAAVAESPFLSFAEIGANRLEQFAAPLGVVAPALVPLGMAWANWRHGVDLRLASPEIAAPRIRAPVLLIHGTQDSNIPPRHSEILLPRLRRARLWKVEGAEHAGCFGRDPAAYLAEVDEWFHSAR